MTYTRRDHRLRRISNVELRHKLINLTNRILIKSSWKLSECFGWWWMMNHLSSKRITSMKTKKSLIKDVEWVRDYEVSVVRWKFLMTKFVIVLLWATTPSRSLMKNRDGWKRTTLNVSQENRETYIILRGWIEKFRTEPDRVEIYLLLFIY